MQAAVTLRLFVRPVQVVGFSISKTNVGGPRRVLNRGKLYAGKGRYRSRSNYASDYCNEWKSLNS